MKISSTTHPRRKMLRGLAISSVAPFVSRLSWADGSPMQKLQYAAMGAGGRGAADIGSMTGVDSVRMVAAADVDLTVFPKLLSKFLDLEVHQDWREMDLFFQVTNIIGRRWPRLLERLLPFLTRSIMQNIHRFAERSHQRRNASRNDLS